MSYTIQFAKAAIEDLKYFTTRQQRQILDEVDRQLLNEPNNVTRNRKKMRANWLATWELRIGVFRVYYDVDETNAIVQIQHVAEKKRDKVFIRGNEVNV
jgi:mRNA-degrading endonuclease RelE of RelBE toxin-antitoxin system